MKWRQPSPGKRRSPILDQSLVVARDWLMAEWASRVESPRLQAIYSATLEGDRELPLYSGGVKFERDRLPVITIVPATIQTRQGPFAAWQLQHFGLDTGRPTMRDRSKPPAPRRTARRVYIRPVAVGLGVRFRSNSLEEAMAFAQMWVESAPSVAVDLVDSETRARYRINMSLDDSGVSVPQAGDPGSQQGSTYEIDLTMIVNTYSGWEEDMNVIQRVDVSFVDNGLMLGDLNRHPVLLEKVSVAPGKRRLIEVVAPMTVVMP